MTYCGKNCESCTWRETQGCSGCETGPGSVYGGDCGIARCCREKGHASCQTCTIGQSGCTKWKGCEAAPAERQQLLEHKAARRAEAAAQAPVLGKWLWIVFWLIVPNAVAAFMTMDSVVEAVPALRVPGHILQAVCGVVYAYALWKMKDIQAFYRTASIALLINAALGLLGLLIPESRVGLLLLASLPSLGLALLADYNEFMGHAAVLEGVEEELSANWKKLWEWNVKLLLGILGSFLVVFILPVVGALALLAISVGLLVIRVLKLTYLYRMVTPFRSYLT